MTLVSIIKKVIISLSTVFLLLPFQIFTSEVQANEDTIQKPVPAYAKWGRLAMKETKAKYPKAEIVDYLHVGRTSNPKITTEIFKLWLREGNQEFGVLVTINFNTVTEKITSIHTQKTA